MVQRRTFLVGTVGAVAALGLGAGAAHQLGGLDDAARAIGIRPVPEPHPDDVELVELAAQDTARLQALASGSEGQDDVIRRMLDEHLDALGGLVPSDRDKKSRSDGATSDPMALRQELAGSARLRTAQAVAAVSGELGRTLGSMAAALHIASLFEVVS